MLTAYDKILGGREDWGAWRWCLHCERVYRADTARRVRGLWLCAYADCNGDAVFDQHDWHWLRSIHPEYPEVPEVGKVYALYGPPASRSGAAVGDADRRQDPR